MEANTKENGASGQDLYTEKGCSRGQTEGTMKAIGGMAKPVGKGGWCKRMEMYTKVTE